MTALHFWFAGILASLPSAHATSTIRRVERVSINADCAVHAKFDGIAREDRKIFWKFTNLASDCAAVGSAFQVFVPPAQWHPRLEQVIYPQFLDEPALGAKLKVKLVSLDGRWYFTNFDDGIQAE